MLSRPDKAIIAMGVQYVRWDKEFEFKVHIKQQNLIFFVTLFPWLENILPITKISLLLGKLPK